MAQHRRSLINQTQSVSGMNRGRAAFAFRALKEEGGGVGGVAPDRFVLNLFV